MRASIVVPSVMAAAVAVAIGTVWADAAGRHVTGAELHPVVATTIASTTPPAPASSAAARTTRPSARAKVSVHPAAHPGSGASSTHSYGTHASSPRPVTARHGCASAYASGASSIEAATFNQLNRFRAAAGLCPLQWSSQLHTSASRHSALMDQKGTRADCSDGNYSHQYPGEPPIDSRIYAAGYHQAQIAEAIGCSPDTSVNGAYSLQNLMMSEKPPGDQHRKMILSTVATHVGIAIVVDYQDGTLWLTEDFAS